MKSSQIDEVYIGGLEKNKHTSKRTEGTQERSTKVKSAVVGIKSRVDKKVKVKVTRSVKSGDLHRIIKEIVEDGCIVYTDENLSYAGLNKKKGYKHERVNHGVC